MKKKLALLLAAVMVAAMVPVSAFAASTNRVTNIATMKAGDKTTAYNTPSIVLEEKDAWAEGDQFELVLDGATWAYEGFEVGDENEDSDATYVLLSDTRLSVELTAATATAGTWTLPIHAKVTGAEATVTVDPVDSKMTAGTYVFAVTTSSAATVKVDGTVEVELDGTAEDLKAIIITETVANALEDGKEITFKLYNDFKYDTAEAPVVAETIEGLTLTAKTGTVDGKTWTNGFCGDELVFVVDRTGTATKAGKISITNIAVKENKAEAGDVAEIVVSGAGIDSTTLEVAKAITYGVSFKAADKKVPVFYAGSYNTTKETLEVTFKELAEDSWWAARKTTLTFPEEVKVIEAKVVTGSNKNCTVTVDEYDKNVVELSSTQVAGEKAEWKMVFHVSVSPKFQGDITCTVGGPALKEDITVVVGEAVYPVTWEVETYDVSIDYRNVQVGDITIIENYAGALEEGATLTFSVDEIELEGKAKVEVEGDIEVELENTNDSTITLVVTDASYKAPSTIKITGVEAYLHRSLPAGDYSLKVTSSNTWSDATTTGATAAAADADNLIKNYASKKQIKAATAKGQAGWAMFDISGYTLADDYITVVTAGRDQDDSTFTTQVAITIGANTMNVGGAVVALDVPAYISNGYTMLPVRAVATALSSDGSTILWDDATKTVTIAFGARIISMTIGSKVMNINGVAVAMTAAPEVTNGRTFLPVRDLAYALGLTEADIDWNDETKTATLN